MKKLMALVLGIALLPGCSKSAVDAVKDWADSSCKCKDEACAKKQEEEFNKLERKYEKDFDNEKTAEQADAHLERGNKCLEAYGVSAG
jgi:hypothetical protein